MTAIRWRERGKEEQGFSGVSGSIMACRGRRLSAHLRGLKGTGALRGGLGNWSRECLVQWKRTYSLSIMERIILVITVPIANDRKYWDPKLTESKEKLQEPECIVSLRN